MQDRVIKFRLRIGGKIVGYNLDPFYCKDLYGEYPDNLWRRDYIYHTEKDQFIGLVDADKKEIYEGDRVEDITTGEVLEVAFSDGCFVLTRDHILNRTVWEVPFFPSSWRVINNIKKEIKEIKMPRCPVCGYKWKEEQPPLCCPFCKSEDIEITKLVTGERMVKCKSCNVTSIVFRKGKEIAN